MLLQLRTTGVKYFSLADLYDPASEVKELYEVKKNIFNRIRVKENLFIGSLLIHVFVNSAWGL